MFVNNVPLASPATDTTFDIEVAIPDIDNIMGWEYGLSFIPGSTGEPTAVQIGGSDTTYYARVDAWKDGGILRIRVWLDNLRCDPGTGTYGPCTGGGKFALSSFRVLSWFKDNGDAVADNVDGRGEAATVTGFVGRAVSYGSPRGAPTGWMGTFYIGEASWQGRAAALMALARWHAGQATWGSCSWQQQQRCAWPSVGCRLHWSNPPAAVFCPHPSQARRWLPPASRFHLCLGWTPRCRSLWMHQVRCIVLAAFERPNTTEAAQLPLFCTWQHSPHLSTASSARSLPTRCAVADNVYSYTIALEKLTAGTADGQGIRRDVEVFLNARTLDSPGRFLLTIPAASLYGAGRCADGRGLACRQPCVCATAATPGGFGLMQSCPQLLGRLCILSPRTCSPHPVLLQLMPTPSLTAAPHCLQVPCV